MSVNREALLLIVVLMFVGISSFGLGRLSNVSNSQSSAVVITGSVLVNNLPETNDIIESGMYVASRNGTKYYPKDCAGAKKILDNNKVWFSSMSEAEAAGFDQTSMCTY